MLQLLHPGNLCPLSPPLRRVKKMHSAFASGLEHEFPSRLFPLPLIEIQPAKSKVSRRMAIGRYCERATGRRP
jgi:hypothetical protein